LTFTASPQQFEVVEFRLCRSLCVWRARGMCCSVHGIPRGFGPPAS